MMYLDLAELDTVFRKRWLWSVRRPAPARFDRRDHFGDPAQPLDAAVRDLVAGETGRRPAGPIRLLTHLRYFGYCFNPVSFYYCFEPGGTLVQAVVAEVNNTPWGERHCYVIERPATGAAGAFAGTTHKRMHVSPFMPMALDYGWRFGQPGERLNVLMALSPASGAGRVFGAALSLHRLPVTGANLAAALAHYPLMTVQVIAAIHWQALRLWAKRVPVHTHPARDTTGQPSREIS